MHMPKYTRDEAMAFIEAMRITLEGKVGFRWLVDKLADLRDYVETLAEENESLKAFLDGTGAREAYESSRDTRHQAR